MSVEVDEPELSSGARIMRVLRHRQVRKIQLAFLGSTLGDWAWSTAMIVYAYDVSGAKAVGVYQAGRFIAVAVFGPLGGVAADRMSRRAFMVLADAIRAVLVLGAGLLVATDGPAVPVYALGILAALVGAPFRSASAGLITELVDDPADLTAANAVAANVESVTMFAGPALAGLIIGVWGIEEVFWLNAATFLWSMLLLSAVQIPTGEPEPERQPLDESPAAEPEPGFWAEARRGFAFTAAEPGLRNLALISAASGYAWGGMMVFMVVEADHVLGTGPKGLGYLNSTVGLATFVGGVLVLTRLRRSRLARDMTIGVALGFGASLTAIAAFQAPAVVFAGVALLGLMEPWGTLGMETIPQRLSPPDMVSRVYAAVEACLVAPMAIGSLTAPFLIDEIGIRGALAIAGGIALVLSLLLLVPMINLDRRLKAPEELELLRRIDIFTAMPIPALERLAHVAARERVPIGTRVLAEGAVSDRFFVIVSGGVEVTQAGRVLRTEGPGEFFGEIGLLRNVLRTATVTTTADSEFLVVDRGDFLSAAGSLGEGHGVLEDTVAGRLFS